MEVVFWFLGRLAAPTQSYRHHKPILSLSSVLAPSFAMPFEFLNDRMSGQPRFFLDCYPCSHKSLYREFTDRFQKWKKTKTVQTDTEMTRFRVYDTFWKGCFLVTPFLTRFGRGAFWWPLTPTRFVRGAFWWPPGNPSDTPMTRNDTL